MLSATASRSSGFWSSSRESDGPPMCICADGPGRQAQGGDMMSRRNLLLAGIGLAGIAAFARNLFAPGGAHAGSETFEVTKSDAEWKQVLTPEQFQVLRKHGTERPYSSP